MKSQQQLISTQDDALQSFNRIKDSYSVKIEEMTDLKRLIFSSSDPILDYQQKSKLRITIESMLIDLNEELFSISEELAKSFTFERNKTQLGQKAKEFEQRQRQIMKKVKENIDSNPTIRGLRRKERIAQQSPPQKDLNTFGKQFEDNDSQMNQQPSHLRMKQLSPKAKQLQNCTSTQKLNEGYQSDSFIQKNQIALNQTDQLLYEEEFKAAIFNDNKNELRPQTATTQARQSDYNRKCPIKKKSPIPLRRKKQENSFAFNYDESNNNNSNLSSRKQPVKGASASRNSNSASKQLHFRQESSSVNQDSRKGLVPKNKTNKNLEDFENYLSQKQKVPYLKQQQYSSNNNKENLLPNQDQNQDSKDYSTIVLQSEAFEIFSQDFAHMKSKMIQMQKRMDQNEDTTKELKQEVNKLRAENIKMSTDIRMLTHDQNEIIDIVHNLEKKNSQLIQENLVLKRILDGQRELKGQETNLPRAINDSNNQSMASMFHNQNGNHEQRDRKQSPFSSFLEKYRSLGHLRDSTENNQESQIALKNMKNYRSNHEIQHREGMNQMTLTNPMNKSLDRIQQSFLNYAQNQWPQPNQNNLQSVSNERPQQHPQSNTPQSFLKMQQQLNQALPSNLSCGGPSSLRVGAADSSLPPLNRIQKSPANSENFLSRLNQNDANLQTHNRKESIGNCSDRKQHASQQNNENSNNRSFIINSTQKQLAKNGNENKTELSDWVLERIKKQ